VKRFAIVAALAGVVSLGLMVRIMAEETPERAKPAANDATLPRLGTPPSTVVEEEAAVAEAEGQPPAAAPSAGQPPAPPAPPAAGDVEKQLGDVRMQLAAAQKEIDTLKKQVDDLTRLQTAQSADLLAILRQVAEEDGSGKWKLKLQSLSDSKPPADVVRATQGRLLIENTGAERVLYVNGTPWKAIAGKSYIWVPTGVCTISTEGGVEPTVHKDWLRNADTGVFELKFKF
jgi:hypothetical protein